MKYFALLVALVSMGCQHPGSEHDPSAASPYAGEESRVIKALSDEEVQGYLDGAGLGFAKVAELNGYPGPRHVLDLADSLDLTAEQRLGVEEAFRLMKSEAQALGAELVETEKQLDRLFADGKPTAAAVQTLTETASQLTGRIRNAHLTAHLSTADVLTPVQIEAYVRLRGYGDGAGDHSAHDHDREHGA